MDAYNFVLNLHCDLNKRILRTILYTMRTNWCAVPYKVVRSVERTVRLFKSQRNCAQNSTQTFSVYRTEAPSDTQVRPAIRFLW